MKVCDYCGKANDDSALFCAGCGTTLESPNSLVSTQKSKIQVLNARSATIILLVYLAAQILCAFPLTSVKVTGEELVSVGILMGWIVSGIVMIFMSRALALKHLKDDSSMGAAWVLGRRETIVKGLVLGLIIGACDQIFILSAKHHVAYRNLDPFQQMAFTPGLPQWVWIIVAVLLAPSVEEMMFRGVLYGGYRKSFGPVWAAAATTFIFVALHYPYYIHFPSNVFGIIVATLAALWCRLRWNAIGPAIAAHAGYNSMLVLVVMIWR